MARIEGDAGKAIAGVAMGNHRDAWVFGAVDPNSGSAADAGGNGARASGDLLQQGCGAPKRRHALCCCSWDAEEFSG